jgi:hypothetical protein
MTRLATRKIRKIYKLFMQFAFLRHLLLKGQLYHACSPSFTSKTVVMSKNLQIRIPEPCGESWENMGQAGNGRFCSSCSKTVVDFSLMSDQEVLSYLGSQEKKVCGRFTPDQLGRDIRLGQPPAKRPWSVVWRLALVGMLLSVKAQAQQKFPRTGSGKVVKKNAGEPQHVVMGEIIPRDVAYPDLHKINILDSNTGLPVSFATVRMAGSHKGYSANAAGTCELSNTALVGSGVLEISSIGYAVRDVRLGEQMLQQSQWTITLSPQATLLSNLVVTCYPTTKGRVSITGGIATQKGSDTTVLARITDGIQDSLSRILDSLSFLGIKPAALSVYPNPVLRGSVMNLSFRRGPAGPCHLGLFNAAGALILERDLELTGKTQLELLSIPSSLPAGIYFIKMDSPGRAFTQKLVVQ